MLPWGSATASDLARYRIGLTPVFLDSQTAFLRRWQLYLQARLGKPVDFVQRQSYREITEMIVHGQLELAWICGFPYVRQREALRLMAVPLFRGAPLYRSYLIVSTHDRATRDLTDLRGKVFAYSDPDSNSGYLVPQVALRRQGIDPERFFSRTFFTWSHRDVVTAVAEGLADAGAVDGYVWETLSSQNPELTGATRVVTKSEEFGFPPIVARRSLPEQHFRILQEVLLGMPDDPDGRSLLEELNLDGFVPGSETLFDTIRAAALRMAKG